MSNINYINIGNLRVDIIKAINNSNTFVVTDEGFYACYPSIFDGIKNLLVIKNGEESKSIVGVASIIDFLLANKAIKTSTIVAIGGGVVGDVVGFAASIYMRGIDWINIPTTLLAQVDSGIGGKTAVNYGNIKNLLGTYHIPKQTIIDNNFLVTLTDREWMSGVGEIIKTSMLNKQLYEYVKKSLGSIIVRDNTVVAKIIRQCVDIKDSITALDIKDNGIRRILNLGHTIGHALEAMDSYKRSHGEYVLQGIFVETSIFAHIIDQDYLDEIRDILRKLISYNIIIMPTMLADLASNDKKNLDKQIHFVVPVAIGEVKDTKISKSELIKRLKEFVKSNENFVYKKF